MAPKEGAAKTALSAPGQLFGGNDEEKQHGLESGLRGKKAMPATANAAARDAVARANPPDHQLKVGNF